MQKFKKYIYCNDEMLYDFINQIEELSSFEKIKEKEKITSVGGKGGIPGAKLETQMSENTKTVVENRTSEIEQFINWANNFNNSLNINEQIPNENDKGCICILNGKAFLPEKVEEFELFESFKDNLALFSTIDGIDMESIEQAQLLKNSSSIPILIDISNNYVVHCPIIKKHLKETLNDFFESIEDDITIIGRIDKINLTGKIEIFDIAKECLKINRTLRRKMTPEQLESITISEEAPLIKITPLIIYK